MKHSKNRKSTSSRVNSNQSPTLFTLPNYQEISARYFKSKLNMSQYRLLSNDTLREQMIVYNAASTKDETMNSLIPLFLYFLSCNLPLNYLIERIDPNLFPIKCPNELFQLLFQNSEKHLKAIFIHHYSFCNPIPFYYPIIRDYSKIEPVEFALCEELWYSLTPHNAVMSFGIGNAANTPVGKSNLIDVIFQLNFVPNNLCSCCFHPGTVDLRLTKNFIEGAECEPYFTDWAFFDYHGPTDRNMVNLLLTQIDIVLIHVLEDDMIKRFSMMEREVKSLHLKDKHIFILIRDVSEVARSYNSFDKNIYNQYNVPDISKQPLSKKKVALLKLIGRKIVQSAKITKFTSRNLEIILKEYAPRSFPEFEQKRNYVDRVRNAIVKSWKPQMSNYGFLNCYPMFIELVKKKYEILSATDQTKIDNLNKDCIEYFDALTNMRTFSEGSDAFQKIISHPDSVLILWKLGQELQLLTNESNISGVNGEQSNDKYSIEILWREAILIQKYVFQNNLQKRNEYTEMLSRGLSALVKSGEPFELIDGDNLVFFSKELNSMLRHFHVKQTDFIQQFNMNNPDNKVTEAPLVLSVIGPQSSGKSTLLNYMFGCKFVTSTGRCTRGVYGSLLELNKPINKSKFLLILDTEGITATERDYISTSSSINFDRSLTLFCLSVSNVVIINMLGELDTNIHELMKICAHSLNHLKVHKTTMPKIMFVLNQIADPKLENRRKAIQLLMKNLDTHNLSGRNDMLKISKLIKVTEDDMFTLPNAYVNEVIDMPGEEVFQKEVTSQSIAENFALTCSALRKSIFEKLQDTVHGERPTFTSLSEWFEMAGDSWSTIIRFQDIVRFRNLTELETHDELKKLTCTLMEQHFYQLKNEIQATIDEFSEEIRMFDSTNTSTEQLNEQIDQKTLKFENLFRIRKQNCILDFKTTTSANPESQIYIENLEKLEKLITTEKLDYTICLKTRSKEIYNHNKRRELFTNFKKSITSNVANYLTIEPQEQDEEFERLWKNAFQENDLDELYREQNLTDFYLMFSTQWDLIPLKKVVKLYHKLNYSFDDVDTTLLKKLELNLTSCAPIKKPFFYPTKKGAFLKDLQPHCYHSTRLEYLNENTFYYVHTTEGQESKFLKYFPNSKTIYKHDWVPEDCVPLLQSCSGYYSDYDINWKHLSPQKQITKLVTCLVNSNFKGSNISTDQDFENKFIQEIIKETTTFVTPQDIITPITIQRIADALDKRLSIFNHEISYIGAELTIYARRSIGSYVFSKIFRLHFNRIWSLYCDNRDEISNEKKLMKKYFLKKVEISKIIQSNEDPSSSTRHDEEIAEKYVKNYEILLNERIKYNLSINTETLLRENQDVLSYQSLFQEADRTLSKELNNDEHDNSTNYKHFVVKYFCNRNKVLREIFDRKLEDIIKANIDHIIANTIETQQEEINQDISQLGDLLSLLHSDDDDESRLSSKCCFKSDKNQPNKCDNFKLNESPYRSMVLYLHDLMAPWITKESMQERFEKEFECNDVRVALSSDLLLRMNILRDRKFNNLFYCLKKEGFFESELIFNLYSFLSHFKQCLGKSKLEFSKKEFREQIMPEIRNRHLRNSLGCPGKCPCCGISCSQPRGHYYSRCSSSFGHQFASMGGKTWGNDKQHSAIFLRCEDYTNDMTMAFPGGLIKWSNFKELTSSYWDWQKDSNISEEEAQKRMFTIIQVWDRFGRGILEYHRRFHQTYITFRPYEENTITLESASISNFQICFVIDGTGSMGKDIENVRNSIQRLVDLYKETNKRVEFRTVIYRDHCDINIIEANTKGGIFIKNVEQIMKFLTNITPEGGGDVPEASLDGLVEGLNSNWDRSGETRRLIIHVYDAPPHGNFPSYRQHNTNSNPEHCCCCSGKCEYDWERDVWKEMGTLGVEYHGINTGEKRWVEFEKTMKKQLDYLCKGFTICGKEQVNDTVMQIFINYQSDA